MQSFSKYNLIEKSVPMGNPEWEKNNGKTGEPRIDILKRLIKQGSSIELAKGGSFKVDKDDVEDSLKVIDAYVSGGYKAGFTLNASDGKVYKNTFIGKTEVFGGGVGGAGSGTKDTERNESHNACMMKAIVDHGYNNDIDFFNDQVIAKAYKDNGTSNISANTDKILETPEDWVKSSYYASKFLAEKGYINKNMTFHRGDKKMTMIYTLKNIAYKNNGFSPLKDDKWNPGDVWAIDKSFDFKVLDVSSVTAYNTSLIKAFNERKLVGISLKKVVKYPPYTQEYNNQVPPDTDLHKVKSLNLSSGRGDFWSSKNGFLVYDSGILIFKDNTAGGTIKAEVKGSTSRGGGISWGGMVEFVKRETKKDMGQHAKSIKPVAKKIEKELNLDEKKQKTIQKNWWPMYREFNKNDTYEEMIEELKKKDWTWISAKLAIMTIFYHIQKAGGVKANAITTHLVNYAGSQMSESAVYIKVGK